MAAVRGGSGGNGWVACGSAAEVGLYGLDAAGPCVSSAASPGPAAALRYRRTGTVGRAPLQVAGVAGSHTAIGPASGKPRTSRRWGKRRLLERPRTVRASPRDHLLAAAWGVP